MWSGCDELLGDVLWCRELIARRRISFAEQDAILDDVFLRYWILRCCMDQTGMGEKPVEDAKRRYGETRVEGVLFTTPNKLTLATQGKESFEDRKSRIPMGDAVLKADLHKLQKVNRTDRRASFCGRQRQRGPRRPNLGQVPVNKRRIRRNRRIRL